MHGIELYEDNLDDDMLEQFVLDHRPLVKKIALHIKRRLPSHIELDDLLQAGLIGLLEARKNYKNDMGTAFETFASIRIRGSIIDSLRKSSCISRETIKNMRRISDAISKIEQRNQRHATPEEIAQELGISLDEHFKLSQDIHISSLLSLDEFDHDSLLVSSDENTPEGVMEEEGLKEKLKEVLQLLPEREQLVLSLYYVEEFTFKQIGEILELTEARICQLHTQAIARVRGKLIDE